MSCQEEMEQVPLAKARNLADVPSGALAAEERQVQTVSVSARLAARLPRIRARHPVIR